MGSVTDLISLAGFQQSQGGQSPGQDMGTQYQAMLAQIEKNNQQRRFRENQKKLSDMLMKNIGGLDSEYSVGETGNISVKYKSKKDPETKFADAVKESGERIAAGEDYEDVSGELTDKFPKLYNDRIDTYLSRFIPEGQEEIKVGGKRKPPTEVGKYDPRRIFPAFAHSGDQGQKDNFGFTVGETKSKGGKTYKYIGNDQWEEQ